jgi:hypothetical protein
MFLGWLAKLLGVAAAPVAQELLDDVSREARDYLTKMQGQARPVPLPYAAVAHQQEQMRRAAHAFPAVTPAVIPPTCPPSAPPSARPVAMHESPPPTPRPMPLMRPYGRSTLDPPPPMSEPPPRAPPPLVPSIPRPSRRPK